MVTENQTKQKRARGKHKISSANLKKARIIEPPLTTAQESLWHANGHANGHSKATYAPVIQPPNTRTNLPSI